MAFSLTLHLDGSEAKVGNTLGFHPASRFGWGKEDVTDSSGEPIPWERFWAADSPFLRDGRAQLQLTLSVPPT